jgi:dihydroorotase
MYSLKQAGCVAISNASQPFQNLLILRHVMEYAVSHDLLLMFRANEASLSKNGCLHEGKISTQYGLPAIPAAAETIAVAQALELVKLTGCKLHFSQLSCKGSVQKIQQAQKEGIPVSADVAIHQLRLTEQDIAPFDSHYHVIPPLRGQADKMALREALAAGSINAICSDHQPHDLDAKLGTLPETEAGIAAIETLLPLTLQLINDNALTLSQAISLLTWQPAQLLSLNNGTLTAGQVADICIFDPNERWTVDNHHWHSAGKNSPFWNKTLQGKVLYTIQSGNIIYPTA